MDLHSETLAAIQLFIAGSTDIETLRGWLAEHAQDIEAMGDSKLQERDSLAWALISEYDDGRRTEESVRVMLGQAVNDQSLDLIDIVHLGPEWTPAAHGSVTVELGAAEAVTFRGDSPVVMVSLVDRQERVDDTQLVEGSWSATYHRTEPGTNRAPAHSL